jgi:alkylhydroperoxidase family enzyme
MLERLARYPDGEWSDKERAVLDFASKMVRTSYKVTEKDSAAFRAAGLDDAAYVDVLNTVSIQTTMERVANMFGVVPDATPLLKAQERLQKAV